MITLRYLVRISDHIPTKLHDQMLDACHHERYWLPDKLHTVKITGEDYADCESQIKDFVKNLREKNKVHPMSTFVKHEGGVIEEIIPEIEETKSYHYELVDENDCKDD